MTKIDCKDIVCRAGLDVKTSAVWERLDECSDMINELRCKCSFDCWLRAVETFLHCVVRLKGLSRPHEIVTLYTDHIADYSFNWSGCKMYGGFIFHELRYDEKRNEWNGGWSLHS